MSTQRKKMWSGLYETTVLSRWIDMKLAPSNNILYVIVCKYVILMRKQAIFILDYFAGKFGPCFFIQQ